MLVLCSPCLVDSRFCMIRVAPETTERKKAQLSLPWLPNPLGLSWTSWHSVSKDSPCGKLSPGHSDGTWDGRAGFTPGNRPCALPQVVTRILAPTPPTPMLQCFYWLPLAPEAGRPTGVRTGEAATRGRAPRRRLSSLAGVRGVASAAARAPGAAGRGRGFGSAALSFAGSSARCGRSRRRSWRRRPLLGPPWRRRRRPLLGPPWRRRWRPLLGPPWRRRWRPLLGPQRRRRPPLRGPQRRRLVPPVLRQPPEAQEPRTQSVPGVAYVLRRVMAANQQRPFHSVVFSVSGFPGEFVTEEVAREQVSPKRSTLLPWAVAGSCREKLQRVLERSALKLGRPTLPSEVGMIVCAVTNPASLDEMAAQAAVILNCVRPVFQYIGCVNRR
ncbi:uncharacterized protein LOC102160416 [Sus scrofa]|uniref:uncharacterized protein LOC102160416 n=1 Tax=Sus scrofa TaxID=9823 RepID=UPI000A2B40EF|nr:uncharacterized protein LOC102160416 [Sus scrofa]